MRRFAVLLALVLVFPAGAAPGAASDSPPSAARRAGAPVAFFNVPDPFGNTGANYRIVSAVEAAIRAVPRRTKKLKHPTITISSYLLDRGASVDQLIAACKRGVGVRIVLDSGINNPHSRRLISALNGDNYLDRNNDGKPDKPPRTGKCGKPKRQSGRTAAGQVSGDDVSVMSRSAARASLNVPTEDARSWGRDRSYVKRCSGACRSAGPEGNMHSKFFLFSHTGSRRNVVMVSSSNLNRGGAEAGWNDMIAVQGRKRLYTYFLKIHRLMTRETPADGRILGLTDGPFTARFFPVRAASKAKDPVLADLRQIRCSSGLGRTEVHISMFFWGQRRGNYLADRVLELARQGCSVNVIYGAPTKQLGDRLRAAARAGRIKLWDSRFDMDKDGYNEVRTHAKYVLVKGTFGKSRKARVVMTGSQNWVGGMASHDEAYLRVKLPRAYSAYRSNWSNIRDHSKRYPQP